MSWIRFSDDFLDDPAVMALGDDEPVAMLEYHRLVAWSAKHLTDGELPIGAVRRADPRGIAALLRVGLVEPRPAGAAWLPRFLDRVDAAGDLVFGHHPSREFVEERRLKRTDAGRKGGQVSAEARARARAAARALANGQAGASADGVAKGVPLEPRSPVPDSTNPVPFRARGARGVRPGHQSTTDWEAIDAGAD